VSASHPEVTAIRRCAGACTPLWSCLPPRELFPGWLKTWNAH
jgi:hypothetical protein